LHPETGKKVVAAIGRFGPYVSSDGQFKSIPKEENVFDIALGRAVSLLAEPKSSGSRGALKILGKHPEDGQSVSLYDGKYGPYVKHGKINATLPDKDAIDTITLEEALALIAEKATKGKPSKIPKAARAPKTAKRAPAKPKVKKAA
jgi:DNA topoisomerase-1